MYPIHFPEQLDTQSFLKQYWQKKPLYLPQAWPEFENPLSPEELAGLALDEEIPSRIVQQHSPTQWSVRQGPFSEDDFAELDGKVWSLLVTDIEKHLPDFMAYVEPFRFIPDWRFDDMMISYAPTGGSVGPHIDDYDVFLIQAEGQRNWQLEGEFRDLPQPQETLIKDTPLRLIKDYQVEAEFLCHPGDMLYLPSRLGHYGIAQSDNCMTWSMGFKAPSFHDMLGDYLVQFVDGNEHKRFIDPDLNLQGHPGEITEQNLTRLKSWFIQQIQEDDETFARWVGQFLTRDVLAEVASSRVEDSESPSQILESNPFVSFKFITLKSQTYLYVGGDEYKVSLNLAKQLTSRRLVDLSIGSKRDSEVVSALLKKGHMFEVD